MGLSQKYVDDIFRKRHNERQRIIAQKRRDKEKKPAPKPMTKEEKRLLAWAKKEIKDIQHKEKKPENQEEQKTLDI